MKRKQVILVDDNPADMKLLHQSFERSGHYTVNESFNSGYDLLARGNPGAADLVVLDLLMPILNGFETSILLRAKKISARILIVSHGFSEQMLNTARESGADGFCRKDYTTIAAIASSMLKGDSFFDHTYYNDWMHLTRMQHLEQKDTDTRIGSIVPVEKKLIKNIAKGGTSEQIASVMGLTKRTIDQYKFGLIQKLGLRNSCELVSWAFVNGVITPNDFYN